MKVIIKNIDKTVLDTIDQIASEINMESWIEGISGNDVILNDAWLDIIHERVYINIDDKTRILLFSNSYEKIEII